MKMHPLIPVVGLACGLLSYCVTPYPPNPYPPAPGNSPYPGEGNNITDEDQEDIRMTREGLGDGEGGRGPSSELGGGNANTPAPTKDYRVAVPVPGKPGFVFNPFTNAPVDVRGIPPGTLVRDPNDVPDHHFRVP